MSELSRRLRQLSSALQWRSLQYEKAQQDLARTLQNQRELEQLLAEKTKAYHSLFDQHQRPVAVGGNVDPAMFEQRLLALMKLRSNVLSLQHDVSEAQQAVKQASVSTTESKLAVEAVTKAYDRAFSAVQVRAYEHERIDIFESSCRQGASR
ncbi:MAG: hypothetical protein U0998_00500 [Moraxellaceae bacterium]|nr:hypothetical protein [Moraxellaceae bacterium]MDZ4385680.1 hypothetical protein [Moraxellaceae bacterium]